MRSKESQTVEWKESWRDEYIRWVCGFANAQGYFWNDGQLPDNWTVAQLLSKHASKPFNPLIANAFFRAGMIESWGRGIEKIKQECEAAGVPVPDYRTDASGLMVKFHTHVMPSGRMTEKMTEKIIILLRTDGSLSIAALAEQIGKSASTVERALRKLREAGAIERIGPDKGGHWVLKEGKP
jgi:ATP-dependent DNA helicase RecG